MLQLKHLATINMKAVFNIIIALFWLEVAVAQQAVTWVSYGVSNNYKSSQIVCRADEGYVDFNPQNEYFFGLSSVEKPTGYQQADYSVKVTTTSSPKKVELYVFGVLKYSYSFTSSIQKVRLSRSGSLLTVSANFGAGLINLYTINTDANLYYRFHTTLPSGGNISLLAATFSPWFCTSCGSNDVHSQDGTINWAQSKMFDGGQQELFLVSKSRAYYNRFGNQIQTQSKNFANEIVIGGQTVLDAHGRPVLNTLPAKTSSTSIGFVSNFLRDASNGVYDYNDFDTPTTLNNPGPVGEQTGTIGHYYSNNNTNEPYVPSSDFPYQRIEYGLDGAVKRMSGIGEMHKMGSGREQYFYRANTGNELNYFYGGKKSYEVNPNLADPLNDIPPLDIPQNIRAIKNISINPDGITSIQYTTPAGLVLATCVSGRPEGLTQTDRPYMPVSHKLYVSERAQYLDEYGTGSVNIHLPKVTNNTLELYYSPSYNVPASPLTYLNITIYDLKKNHVLSAGTDYNLTNVAGSKKLTVSFINNYANVEGFYRTSYNYTSSYYSYYDKYFVRGYEPPLVVKYALDYTDWSINYYDIKGLLRKTVSPKEIDYSIGDPNQYQITNSYIDKDFYNTSGYFGIPLTLCNISGLDNSGSNYGPALDFRIRGMIKSGVVRALEDAEIIDASVAYVDRKTPISPVKPTGGGSYLNLTESQFNALYTPPTDANYTNFNYSWPSALNAPYNYNQDDYPSHCRNGMLDLGEIAVDWGGVCGSPPGTNCEGLPEYLVSFEITLEIKKSSQVLATQKIYRTLGVTCYDRLIEMQNPNGGPSQWQTNITNAMLGSGVSSINVVVSDVKVRNPSDGNYNIAYNPAGTSTHRFIRYIFMKIDYEKEVYLKNTNLHGAKTSYHYNHYGWLLATKDPDRGKTEYIYDDEGKVRFIQDERQRQISQYCFSYILYDKNGRVTQTGEYNGTTNDHFFPNAYYESDAPPIGCLISGNKCISCDDVRNANILPFNTIKLSNVNWYDYDKTQTLPVSALSAYKTMFGENRLTKMSNGNQATWYRYNYRGEVTGSIVQYLGAIDVSHKTFDYEYDFFGRLKKTTYQLNQADERFAHIYTYNSHGDIRFVETAKGNDPVLIHQDVTYYQHGPAKRHRIGARTQGIDYVYTIDGRLKSLNHPSLNNTLDPGKDYFYNNSTGLDVFAISLDYFPTDYVRSNTQITYGVNNTTNERYDGRIKSARWNTRAASIQAGTGKETMYSYEYDWQQNLTVATFGEYTPNAGTNNSGGGGGHSSPLYGAFVPKAANGYTENMKSVSAKPFDWYDPNGNIRYLKRYNGSGTLIDNLTYNYATAKNQLTHVTEASAYTDPLVNHVLPQSTGNYTYNASGNIREDNERNIRVDYNNAGRVTWVKNKTNSLNILGFQYDAAGNRIRKLEYDAAGTLSKSTLYLRDAAGTVHSIFEGTATHTLTEAPLDGGALGTHYPQGGAHQYVYRLSDHLGNVRATVSRNLVSGNPQVLSYADYYSWGMTMPGRELTSSPRYRLGFQGQEYESKIGMYGFSLRMYDQRLGRWFAADPYDQYHSPYLAMSNNPVSYTDPDGGTDGWFDRNTMSYYVDGFEVDAWEFRSYLGSAVGGDALSFSGTSIAGGWEFEYNETFGIWEHFVKQNSGTVGKTFTTPNDPDGVQTATTSTVSEIGGKTYSVGFGGKGGSPNDIIYLFWSPQGQNEKLTSGRFFGNITHHSAILIGNDDTGWILYSKDGDNNPDETAKRTVAKYRNIDDFYNRFAAESGYSLGYRVFTSTGQDEDMKKAAEADIASRYDATSNNCADFCRKVIKAGNVPFEENGFLSNLISLPSSEIDLFAGSNPNGMRISFVQKGTTVNQVQSIINSGMTKNTHNLSLIKKHEFYFPIITNSNGTVKQNFGVYRLDGNFILNKIK